MIHYLRLLAASFCFVFICACGSGEVKEVTDEKPKNETTTEDGVSEKSPLLKKPAYAEKTIEELSDRFSRTSVLDDSKFEKIMPAWKQLVMLSQKKSVDLNNPDEAGLKELEEKINEFGFNDWKELKRTLEVTSTCMMLLPMLEEMEKRESEVAYAMARELSSTLISQGEISKEDLKYVHDHWDEATNILNTMETQ